MGEAETMIPEHQVWQGVVDRITHDSRVGSSDIHVAVEGTRVVLTGTVPTRAAQLAAFEAALRVPGVSSVENNLLVLGPDAARDSADDRIQDEVASLLERGGLEVSGLVVSVDRGVVSLEGPVAACWAKDAASDLVFEAAGVVGVINKLAVVTTRGSTDQTIAAAIVEALERSGGPGCALVDVEVDRGLVTLSGVVPDWPSYRAATDAAWATLGVVAVHNRLEVGQ